MEKLELLDNKHVQDIVVQLQVLVKSIQQYHVSCGSALHDDVFPIEVDLSSATFEYDKKDRFDDPESRDTTHESRDFVSHDLISTD